MPKSLLNWLLPDKQHC